MISTGVEALDGRIGGLRPGGLYVFVGPGAAGKSVLGLHFLIAGLERHERCVLITRDEPVMIDSRAANLGYSPGRLTEHDRLRVVRLPVRLPATLAPSPGKALVEWLSREIGPERPSRIVLDCAESLAEYSSTPHALMRDVARYLESTGAATYALLRADRTTDPDARTDHPLLDNATGVFRLHVGDRGERTFSFETTPNTTFRSESFDYSLRSGGGFTEELPLVVPDLDATDRRRVMVLDESGVLNAETMAGLEELYDVVMLPSSAGALRTLTTVRYGALVLVVDPYEEMRAFDLAFALRREGNAAPIVFISPSRGLRSTTRARGLRVGGDDFFVAELSPPEMVERIQTAWARGSHSRTGLSQIGQIMQPLGPDGVARPMTEVEFLQAMGTLLAEQPPLLFCYLEFTVEPGMADLVWPSLRARIRVGDGDIIGYLPNHRFACVLDRITLEQTWRVVDRVRSGHPGLQAMSEVAVIASPTHVEAIRERVLGSEAAIAGGS